MPGAPQGNVGEGARRAFWRNAARTLAAKRATHQAADRPRESSRHNVRAERMGSLVAMQNVDWLTGRDCSTTAVPVTPRHMSPLNPEAISRRMDARVDQSEGRFLTHQKARLIVFGMLLPVFMSSLDNTILASALPTIGREFGDMRSLPWLITMYMLAATAIVPLYGKIADIRGRQFTLRIAICGYIAGSLVCALAPNMIVLIFG